MDISVDDLSSAEVATFLAEHMAEMRSTTPPESKHALDLEELRQPDITFWTVNDGNALVGCGALKQLDNDEGEIKSMRTAPSRKRSGVASRLLAHIISEAASRGIKRLSLETGSGDFFAPARALYTKFGFESCDPFGHYKPDPNSVFMTRQL